VTVGAIHQFVPTLERGGVGGHLLEVRRLVQDMGLRTETFAEHIRPDVADIGRPVKDYGGAVPARPGDVLLYHLAIGAPLADTLAARSERLGVVYHNVTPERFLAPWEPDAVHGLSWGRKQLADLAGRCDLGIAVSGHNRRELDALGYRRTVVAPIITDLAAFEREVDEPTLARLEAERDGPVWLFVGRVSPNKCHQDLIKAFAVHRRAYAPTARLRLVGAPASDRYVDALRAFVAALDLGGAVEITGSVTGGQLTAHYRAADVFVCLSEHEGFCVPLLEAMHHRLPIVAFAATAVPETLGGAGLVLPTKGAGVVAAAVDRVVGDPALADALVRAGTARLAEFDLTVTRRRTAEALELLAGG
jgi:L-malate glycosyltransferase